MCSVIRPLLSIIVSTSVVAAGLAAPMMHVHDDADHASAHHAGRVVHSHRQIHRSATRHAHQGSSLENEGDTGERAHAIDPFQMVVGWSKVVVGLPQAIVSPPSPVAKAITPRLLVQHSHDPPLARTRPSRAPPALLS
jgi:hypothetical protein